MANHRGIKGTKNSQTPFPVKQGDKYVLFFLIYVGDLPKQ